MAVARSEAAGGHLTLPLTKLAPLECIDLSAAFSHDLLFLYNVSRALAPMNLGEALNVHVIGKKKMVLFLFFYTSECHSKVRLHHNVRNTSNVK